MFLLDEGIKILELANKAATLYEKQPMMEKKRLVEVVFSNSIWKDNHLIPTYRYPFNFLAFIGDNQSESA